MPSWRPRPRPRMTPPARSSARRGLRSRSTRRSSPATATRSERLAGLSIAADRRPPGELVEELLGVGVRLAAGRYLGDRVQAAGPRSVHALSVADLELGPHERSPQLLGGTFGGQPGLGSGC